MLDGLQLIKAWLVATTGLGKDALHIHVGLIVFLGSALLRRWPLTSWKPWGVVLAVALTGEAWDMRDTVARDGTLHLWENWKDVWNTMLWPSAFLILARTTQLFRATQAAGSGRSSGL